MSWLDVLDGGPLTTIQDAGRPGLAHLGISPAGFLDTPAARLANRLVGNDEGAAVLETTGRGPTLRLGRAGGESVGGTTVIALTGAPALVDIDGRRCDPYRPHLLRSGQMLTIGAVSAGIRSYLAVRGGLAVDPVLGSRSTDLLSGLGSPVLQAGQRLPLGRARHPVPDSDLVAVAAIPPGPILDVYAGPGDGWFTADSLRLLTCSRWTVSPVSSRVGLRLDGPPLTRSHDRELPPEGLVTGSIQVPPDGRPVLLLNDHPTTGGYPVIAVVAESQLHFAAQAAPGSHLRFRRHGSQAGSMTTAEL